MKLASLRDALVRRRESSSRPGEVCRHALRRARRGPRARDVGSGTSPMRRPVRRAGARGPDDSRERPRPNGAVCLSNLLYSRLPTTTESCCVVVRAEDGADAAAGTPRDCPGERPRAPVQGTLARRAREGNRQRDGAASARRENKRAAVGTGRDARGETRPCPEILRLEPIQRVRNEGGREGSGAEKEKKKQNKTKKKSAETPTA